MAGLRDLLKRGAGQVERGFDIMREKAAGAAQGAQDFFEDFRQGRLTSGPGSTSGLRGAATQPSSRASGRGAWTPEEVADFERRNPEQAARMRTASRSIPPELRGRNIANEVPTKPRLRGPAATMGPAPRATLRGALSRTARFGARAVPVLAAGEAILQASEGNTPEQRAGGSALRGGLAEFGDIVGLGFGREVGTGLGAGAARLVQTPGGIGTRLRAAASGFGEGFRDATAAEEAAQAAEDQRAGFAPAPRAAPTTPGPQAAATAAGARPDVAVPAEARLDPRAMLADARTPVPAGTGAFQRAGGEPTLIDTRAQLRGAPTQVAADQRPTSFGPIGELTRAGVQLAGEQRAQARAGEATDRAIRLAQAGVAAQNANEERVLKSIGDEVARDPRLAKMDKEEREGIVTQETADLAQRFRRSAAAQGKTLGQLTPVEQSQLKIANDFRKSLEQNRGALEFFRDFFGDNRFESENLFEYIPDNFRQTALGPTITLGGNQIEVNKVVRNGKTHWFMPNDPTKTDMTALVKLARQKSEKKGAR